MMIAAMAAPNNKIRMSARFMASPPKARDKARRQNTRPKARRKSAYASSPRLHCCNSTLRHIAPCNVDLLHLPVIRDDARIFQRVQNCFDAVV